MSTLSVRVDSPGLGRDGALARAVALLRASHSEYGRWLAVLLYALLVGIGLILLQFANRSEKIAIVLMGFVGIATAILWALWFARLVLLHIDAREGRLPTLARDLPIALVVALIASVLLPALLLTNFADVPVVLALQLLTVCALAGLGLALLPVGVCSLLGFTPLALSLINRALTAQLGPGFWSGLGLHPFRFSLSWLLFALSLFAIWRWRATVSAGKAAFASPWSRPLMAQRGPLIGMTGGDGTATLWRAHMPDWLWPSGKAIAGPGQPLHAMRSWLGTPFAPLHARQLVLQLVLGAGMLLVMALGVTSDSGSKLSQSGIVGGIVGGVSAGVAMLVSMYAWRLEQLRRSVASELAELTLLPGWGDATHARRTLLSAVTYSPLRASAVVSALLFGSALLAGLGPSTLLLLGASIVLLALVMAMACLRPLAGQPLMHWFPITIIVLAMLLSMVSLFIYGTSPERSPGPGLFLGFALLSMATVAALWDSWGRFTARAHPFLQD